jgi:hypothetical protein
MWEPVVAVTKGRRAAYATISISHRLCAADAAQDEIASVPGAYPRVAIRFSFEAPR